MTTTRQIKPKKKVTKAPKPKRNEGSYKPNAPTVFINKQTVMNDPNTRRNNGNNIVYDEYDQPILRNSQRNQVAITVQSVDNALLVDCERAIMNIIDEYMTQ
jgi:hypothetical protein